jgi:hypothetical protein
VFAQVNEIVDKLPRIDIPADQVDFVVEAPYPMHLQALFTRDPAAITDVHFKRIAAPALRHRLRRNPLDDSGSTVRVDRAVAELMGD